MCKRTIAVLGLAATGLLTAAGPAAGPAAAEDGSRAAAPCAAARLEITGGPSVTAGALLDTSAVRTFLQGLVRPADRPGALPRSADASFAEAAEFPGVLDAFLLDVEREIGVSRPDSGTEEARLTAADGDTLARRILEPLVAAALDCAPSTTSSAADTPDTDTSATGTSDIGASSTDTSSTDTSSTGTSDVGASDTGWAETGLPDAGSSAEAEPASLLDAAGATAVLEALVNRPETCVTDGTSTVRAGDDGMSVTSSSSRVSLLDALGVRRTLDMLTGRPSAACPAADAPLSAATTEQDRPRSLLGGLGLGALFSRLLG
ncbi:hypothetical protein ABT158_16395 [Nonomuraea sp. NPDC001636]|uniref:hypothetical protein n=1 Tax=Nonomuraea sp. NPDC001636 TaxID=3154391 RepID=UPI00332159DD